MKKRKRLLVILSTFVMAAQPLCVAAEMQDAEGFGAVEEIWADEENEEEFSAAPEVGNEDLNGFQAEISTEENDRIEAEESGEIISGAIAGDSVDSGISLFSLDYYTDSYGAQLDGRPCTIFWCRIMWWITASIWTALIFLLNFLIPLHLKQLLRMAVFREKEKAMYRLPMM